MGCKSTLLRAALLVLCLAALGCAEMKPGDRPRNANDSPTGPGMLSGDNGEFVIYRVDKPPPEEELPPADETGWRDLSKPEAAETAGTESESVQ